ncbi:MAG: hypothetical protein KGN32_02820 [Burkholderiales bacterium]|nr:hypothetical protein [Burkholderiales bacterium]
MKNLLVVLLLALSIDVSACSCFPPELRAKTAQDALVTARLAVFGRVMEVDASGKAKLQVIEANADLAQCAGRSFTVGEEVLMLSFEDTVTVCHKHPPGHYLLDAFRSNSAKAK